MLGWLTRRGDGKREAAALYDAVVALGRQPHWYLAGRVPDTVDGRFDAIAAVLAVVLLRLEAEPGGSGSGSGGGGAGAATAARVTERFVDDMDAQMREIGIGDIVVGKHVGRMMSMLGGRLGAYRDGFASGDLAPALARNLYRGDPPDAAAVAHVAAALTALRARLAALPLDAVVAGRIA